MAHAVALALQATPGVRAVASPATSPLLVPAPGGFAVRRLVEDGRPAADRARLGVRARADPLWVGSLVSSDGDVGALVVEIASSRSELGSSVLRALDAALAPWEARGFRFHRVGDPVEFVVAGGELLADAQRLAPAILGLAGAMIFVLLRSIGAALAALASVALALVWSFGLMGWLDWPRTAVTPALAPLLAVVGLCSAVHVIARYAVRLEPASAEGAAREAAMLAAVREVAGPCCVVAAAIAAGFASFAAGGVLCFRHFGLIAAFGALAALALGFVLLPIVLVRIPAAGPGAAAAAAAWSRALERVVDGAQRRSRLVLGVAAALCLVAAIGVARLRIEVDVYHLFGEQTRVVRWIRFVAERLRAPDTLDLVLTLPAGRSLEDPEALAVLERVSQQVARLPGLGRARSLWDPLARLNRVRHGDDPAFERPAASAAENAELLRELARADPRALERWASPDRRELRVEVGVEAGTQRHGERVLARVRELLAADWLRAFSPDVNGPVNVFVRMIEEVQRTQLSSFAIAALVIAAVVAALLRSLSWALAAMLPTLFPVLVTLGAMGLFGVYLDIGTAMIGAVVLAIAIDDTVHLLTGYRRRLALGSEPAQAIRGAVLDVGRALVTASLALSLGCFVLTLSSWESVASFGFLSGIAILVALAADLVILPAVIAVRGVALQRRTSWIAG
jgi:predicted RND superfamily exporter protein